LQVVQFFKIDFIIIQKLILSLFVPLQIIQLLSKIFFYIFHFLSYYGVKIKAGHSV